MKVMRIAQNFEDSDSNPTTTDAAFKKGKSIKEGVSGRLGIDTTYEQAEADLSYPANYISQEKYS